MQRTSPPRRSTIHTEDSHMYIGIGAVILILILILLLT
jgi:hypothetical protein